MKTQRKKPVERQSNFSQFKEIENDDKLKKFFDIYLKRLGNNFFRKYVNTCSVPCNCVQSIVIGKIYQSIVIGKLYFLNRPISILKCKILNFFIYIFFLLLFTLLIIIVLMLFVNFNKMFIGVISLIIAVRHQIESHH